MTTLPPNRNIISLGLRSRHSPSPSYPSFDAHFGVEPPPSHFNVGDTRRHFHPRSLPPPL